MPETPEKPLSKEDANVLHTAAAAQNFLNSKFGKFYVSILQGHIEQKRQEYEAPVEVVEGGLVLDGISQVLRGESAKGAILGLRLALAVLDGMVVAGANLRKEKNLPSTAGEDE